MSNCTIVCTTATLLCMHSYGWLEPEYDTANNHLQRASSSFQI